MQSARRTQEQRSTSTRKAILDAAIDVLSEHGYTHATIAAIAERAGVSRGALVHHYASRSDLLLATTDALFDAFVEQMRLRAEEVSASRLPLEGFIDSCWAEVFEGRWFYCSLQLISAARTDPDLRDSLVPAIQRLHTALDTIWRGVFDKTDLSAGRVDTLLNMTLCLMRGMAVQAVLRDDPAYYQEILSTWKQILPVYVRAQSSHLKSGG
jgi:AcrR family transcriptional regulator